MEHLQTHWSPAQTVDLECAPTVHHREAPPQPQPQELDFNSALPYEVISTRLSSMVLDASPTPRKISRAQAPPCPDLEDAFTSSARISKIKECEVESLGMTESHHEWSAPPPRRKKASSRPTYTFDACLSGANPVSSAKNDALPPAIIKHIEDSTSRALVLYKPPSSLIKECVRDRQSEADESDENVLLETMEID